MQFEFTIPTANEATTVTLMSGSSAVFVGANGGGKTRLAVHIETTIAANAHRISAHRSLIMNPKVAKISEMEALGGLRYGATVKDQQNLRHREGSRWRNKAATHLLSDFDFLMQALFAEQANTSLKAYHANKPGVVASAEPFKVTRMDELKGIWERLLPHRVLTITGDDISVTPAIGGDPYDASEMSDGERAIFYMIGQTLVAAKNQLLIIDEPELHMHPSIMAKLWDELEAARPDCAFVYITHDLNFATNRSAQKFVVRDYEPLPTWTIDAVPSDSGFSEELATLILGSRRPILFVEGGYTSLDLAIYRACYPDWTVVPRSSCTEVIHSVVTMRNNASLTRVTCSGIVDGDDYDQGDKDRLAELGIRVLPVAEVENLLLLPSVTAAIADHEGHVGQAAVDKQSALAAAVFTTLDTDQKIEKVVIEYCKRRIDRALKKVDLSDSSDLAHLLEKYCQSTAEIVIPEIAARRTQEIKSAIEADDLTKLLEYYENKGLLAHLSSHLRNQRKDQFEDWVVRSMRNDKCPALKDALSAVLPNVTAG